MILNGLTKRPFDPLGLIYWGVFLAVLVVAWRMYTRSVQTDVPVFARDVPAFHVIEPNDLVTKKFNAREVTADTVRDPSALNRHFTQNAIKASQPIHKREVVAIPDQSLITNTVAVPFAANSQVIFSDLLSAGDVVSLAVMPKSVSTSATEIILDSVLVLSMDSTGSGKVITLALPADRWSKYLPQSQEATVVIARRVK